MGGRGHTRLSPFSAAAPQHPRVALLPMAGEGATRPQGFRLPSFHVSDLGGRPPTQVPHVEMRAPSHAHAHARCMPVGVCTCGHARTGSTCVHVYRHVYIKEAHARSVRTRNEHEKHTHEAHAHADMHTRKRTCMHRHIHGKHTHACTRTQEAHVCAHTCAPRTYIYSEAFGHKFYFFISGTQSAHVRTHKHTRAHMHTRWVSRPPHTAALATPSLSPPPWLPPGSVSCDSLRPLPFPNSSVERAGRPF